MVANGIVVSQLCYMIQVWGGCEGYLLNSLQIIMNRVARCVTRSGVWCLYIYQKVSLCLQLVECESTDKTKEVVYSNLFVFDV